MELTLQLQLLPDAEQATWLQATVERFNAACTWLAQQAFAQRLANKRHNWLVSWLCLSIPSTRVNSAMPMGRWQGFATVST